MSDLELGIDFKLNTPEAQAEAQRIRNSITGVGDTADQQAKRVEASVAKISAANQAVLDKYAKNAREAEALWKSKQTSTGTPNVVMPEIKNNIKDVAEDVLNLKNATDQNNESQKEGTSILDDLSLETFTWTGLVGLATTAILANKEKIYDWVVSLFTGQEANDKLRQSQEDLNSAIGSAKYSEAIKSIYELKAGIEEAEHGHRSSKAVIDLYNETLGEAAGKETTLKGVKDSVARNSDNYVEAILKEAYAQKVLTNAIEKRVALEERKRNGANFTDKSNALTTTVSAILNNPSEIGDVGEIYSQAKRREREYGIQALASDEKEGFDEYKKVYDDLQIFLKKTKLTLDKADKPTKAKTDSTIKERESLISRLNDLDAEYARKSYSKDEEEIQALKDKFTKISKLVLDFNKKNPKAAISLVALNETEKTALSDLKYRQDTEHLKTKIENDKKLYDDYEKYKTEFGEAKAKERFGKQLNAEKTYLQQLQVDYAITLAQGYAGGFTAAIQERLTAQGKAIKEEKANEQKALDEAYKAVQTQAEKVYLIKQRYVALASKLNGTMTEAQRADLIRQMDDEIKASNQTAFEKTAIYRKMNEQTIIYTKEALKAEIKAVENILKDANLDDGLRSKIEGNLTKLKGFLAQGTGKTNKAELEKTKKNYEDALVDPLNSGIEKQNEYLGKLKEIQKQIDKTTDGGAFSKMFEGNASQVAGNVSNGLGQLSGAFGELSASLEGTNDELAYTLGSIGQLVKVGSDAAGAFSSFASGDIIGGVTKTISAVAGLFSMGKKVREMNEKARAEQQKFYDEALKGEREYQALLRKREQDEVKRGKNSYHAIVDQLELLKKQSPEVKKAYDAIFASLQGQQSVEGVGYQHGTWFRKAKTWDIMASLAGSDYSRLEQLYTQGKLKDQAKADFEALKALKEELKEAGVNVEELQQQLNELLTGTSVDGLADGLIALFENGKTAAEDFGQSFEQIMSKAVKNSLKEKLLKDALQPFYDEFASLFVNGTPTEDQLAALKAKYQSIGLDFADKFKELEKITGTSLTDENSTSNPNTIRGNVENITAKQADVLSGNIAGMRMEIIRTGAEQLAAIKTQNAIQTEISANTLRTANNTDRLQAIEKALVSMDGKMNSNSNSIRATGG